MQRDDPERVLAHPVVLVAASGTRSAEVVT
jgi:hypothetical protein